MERFGEDIKNACKVLTEGGLVLYPTDTVWGIGCDATNEDAVRRVYELKKRADHKAMLVLLDSPAKIDRYVSEIPDVAYDLAELADKPLTIIYPGARNLALNLLGEDRSIGIRITREAFSQKLCETFRKPVVSTSANISGQPSPMFFDDISEGVKQGVDYVVKYRRDDKTGCKPSGIIRFGTDGSVQIIRK
ncbi:MAG: threonylcarbamoyl-AMP synthase [Tannerella sp.]|jgi:L-threonylcarbamoyladenylate synthase|nr:threonylcarbamoyl-AMP synthase [Tannerella sp.]